MNDMLKDSVYYPRRSGRPKTQKISNGDHRKTPEAITR